MRAFIVRVPLLRSQSSRSAGSLSFSRFGNASDVLSLSTSKSDLPSPTAGQVKIATKASQVLPEDIRSIHGLSMINKKFGVAGSTAVGVVTGVPSGESDLRVNDTVLVLGSGLWADEALVSKASVAKLSNLVAEDAATLPTFLSAWGILHATPLKAGDVVVQSSGNSAVGSAISQVGKALGLTVVSPSSAELADPKVVSTLKAAHKTIKLAVSDRSGRVALDLARTVSNDGALVFYNGHVEPLEQTGGVDQPTAQSIYNNVSLLGFDLAAWHAADPSGFQQGLAAVLALGSEKKISLKPKVFAAADYKKALADVEATGAAAVLKF